jgi:hypothetical protein
VLLDQVQQRHVRARRQLQRRGDDLLATERVLLQLLRRRPVHLARLHPARRDLHHDEPVLRRRHRHLQQRHLHKLQGGRLPVHQQRRVLLRHVHRRKLPVTLTCDVDVDVNADADADVTD